MPTFVNDANGNTPLYYIAVTITNNQSSSTTANMPVYVSVNSNTNSSYYASNLINVNWQDGNGNILDSWLESGETNTSTASVYWVKIPSSITGSGGTLTIYQVIYATSATSMDGSVTGAEPKYTATYGQYDSGANVFTNYTNFAGTSAPTGWTTQTNSGTITFNNSMYISAGTGQDPDVISNWSFNPSNYAVDVLIVSQSTNNNQDMCLVMSSSSSSWTYVANSVGYQNNSGLEVESNNGGGAVVVFTASPNPTLPAIITVWTNTLYATYSSVGSTTGNILGGTTDYLSFQANAGTGGNFTEQWVRIRIPPPNNTQPTTTFGSITSNNPAGEIGIKSSASIIESQKELGSQGIKSSASITLPHQTESGFQGIKLSASITQLGHQGIKSSASITLPHQTESGFQGIKLSAIAIVNDVETARQGISFIATATPTTSPVLTTTILDGNSTPIPNATVIWSSSSPSVTVNPIQSTTDASGHASTSISGTSATITAVVAINGVIRTATSSV